MNFLKIIIEFINYLDPIQAIFCFNIFKGKNILNLEAKYIKGNKHFLFYHKRATFIYPKQEHLNRSKL